MGSDKKTFDEINITPLTDIFLVLLIIMMVIAPLLDQQGLNLAVPDNVEATQLDKDNKFLNVTVSNQDTYLIDNQELSIAQLQEFIEENAKDYPEGLIIQTQSESTHGAVVRLMDIARNSGVNNITLTEI